MTTKKILALTLLLSAVSNFSLAADIKGYVIYQDHGLLTVITENGEQLTAAISEDDTNDYTGQTIQAKGESRGDLIALSELSVTSNAEEGKHE